jgi:hypothetical protein
MIISSRPLNACLTAFEGRLSLRLRDLTRRDMETYVHVELFTPPTMKILIRQSPVIAPRLATDIVDKAEGVLPPGHTCCTSPACRIEEW